MDALCEFVRKAGEGGLHGADVGAFYARHPHHRAEVAAAGKVKGFCAKHRERLWYEADEAARGKCRILVVEYDGGSCVPEPEDSHVTVSSRM